MSYPSKFHDILKFYNINIRNNLTTQFSNPDLAKYICTMKEEYIKFWNNSVKHSRKLEFYREFKISYDPEPYLDII